MGQFQQSDSNDHYQIASGSTTRVASNFDSNHDLYNQTIDSVKLRVMRVLGNPTGTIYCRVWNSTGVEQFTVGSVDVETLDTGSWGSSFTDQLITFNASSSYTIQAGDYIGIQYSGGTFNSDSCAVRVQFSNIANNMYIGSDDDNGTFTNQFGHDLCIEVNYPYDSSGGGSGGGGSDGGSSDGSISGDGGSSYAPEYAMKLNIGYIR